MPSDANKSTGKTTSGSNSNNKDTPTAPQNSTTANSNAKNLASNKSKSTVNFAVATETIWVEDKDGADTTANNDVNSEEPDPELYRSTRLKGYITLILASVINFLAARSSGEENLSSTTVVSSTNAQRAYAEATSMCSLLICFFAFCAHLDRWSPLTKIWLKIFDDKSFFELIIIVFLVIWWTVATGIQTTVRGIAGDGKGQYNLYYSTWGCCYTAYWTLERWLVAYGWASFKVFISSWPFRAPGWIAICGFSFLSLMSYLDLFTNHNEATPENSALDRNFDEVGLGQWQWLLFVGAFTMIPSIVFVVIELFRETNSDTTDTGGGGGGGGLMDDSSKGIRAMSFSMAAAASNGSSPEGNSIRSPMRSSRQFTPQRANPLPDKSNSAGGKGPLENILEGFCLALLVCIWIPTVIVATTPGGGASLVGNAYFFTWITTIFVMETFIWFVHDLRKGVHSALQVKEREYQKRQQEVLQKSRALEGKRRLLRGMNEPADDISMDLPLQTMRPGHPVQPSHSHPVFDLSSDEGSRNNDNTSNTNNRNEQAAPIQNRMRRHLGRGSYNDDDDDMLSIEEPPFIDSAISPQGSTVFFEADMSLDEEEDEQHIDPIG